jgi:hypothetical protein
MKLVEFGHGGSPIWSMVARVCLKGLDRNEAIDGNIICLSQPPFKIVLSYVLMWAYDNHYCAEDETSDCHTNYDSGIASIFIQRSRSSTQDRNAVMATLRHVGVLKEILVVSYATMKQILFRASWIPSNL